MIASLPLRSLDPVYCALNNACIASGWGEEIAVGYLHPDVPYLALDAVLDGQPCTTWLLLEPLLEHWRQDASIPADLLEPGLALRFAQDAFGRLGLPQALDILQWGRPKAVVDASTDPAPRYLLTGGVEILLDRLPDGGPRPLQPQRYAALPFPVVFRFGPVTLAAATVGSLEPGDVVLLRQGSGSARVHDHPLFSFHTNGIHIMIDSFDDDPLQDSAYLAPDHAAPDLSRLPVELTFELGRRRMTLADIGALAPGATLSLDDDARRVRVMAAAQQIALGELVRIGDGLGVLLSDIAFPPAPPGHGAAQ